MFLATQTGLMLPDTTISPIAQALTDIVEALTKKAGVETAVLCTNDGLPVHPTTGVGHQVAAISGFMTASAQQSLFMLGMEGSEEVIIRAANGVFLACRSFQAGQSELTLTAIFRPNVPYKQLLSQTVRAIQQTVEK